MASEQRTALAVVQALEALYTSRDSRTRDEAGKFLESFQKSTEAWSITHDLLVEPNSPLQVRVFAAQTLRTKVIYDLHQVPESARLPLKDSVLQLLTRFRSGPRVLSTQLCLALANLALNLLAWKNPLGDVVQAFGSDKSCSGLLLEFLKVLPEECTDFRKSSLTAEEANDRSTELLSANANQVLQMLVVMMRDEQVMSKEAIIFMECFNSWIKELHLSSVVQSPLLDYTFNILIGGEDSFDAATECACTMIRETRDVDECMDSIPLLYTRVMSLRSRIASGIAHEDPEQFEGLTRIFSEAGEAWHMLIARSPNEFLGLVEAIADCTRSSDEDLEVVQYTFNFWYCLKQMIVLDKYQEARRVLSPVYLGLEDVIISHLEYPSDNNGAGDLFGGDREKEDKFRSFRHEMGDILKDCCAVVGPERALRKGYDKVRDQLAASQRGEAVSWQSIEAPLFSMRAMAREVDLDEGDVLPNIMDLLVRLPEHEKIRFAATLVLGRYTEWTARHPEYLDQELNYITSGFTMSSESVKSAAAQALMHFCHDCGNLLVGYLGQLVEFYNQVGPSLDVRALFEVTEGIAHVVSCVEESKIYESVTMFCGPVVFRLGSLIAGHIEPLSASAIDQRLAEQIADEVELLTLFAKTVRPTKPPPPQHPVVKFWLEAWPTISRVLDVYGAAIPVAERVSKLIKNLLYGLGSHARPLLVEIAEKLAVSFQRLKYGCFLWVSGACVREFSINPKHEQQSGELLQEANIAANATWQFTYQQCTTYLGLFQQIHSEMIKQAENNKRVAPLNDIGDLIEDFYLMMGDVVMYMPEQLIESNLSNPVIEASIVTLQGSNLTKTEPLLGILRFLRDFTSYALPRNSASGSGGGFIEIKRQDQEICGQILLNHGQGIVNSVFIGLVKSLPPDCISEGCGLLLAIAEISLAHNNGNFISWIESSLDILQEDNSNNNTPIPTSDRVKFIDNLVSAIRNNEWRKIRILIQDFTCWIARKSIRPTTTTTTLV